MKKLLSLLVLVSSIASAQTRIVHKFVKVGVGFTYQADNGASVAPQQVTQSNVNPEGDVLRIFFNNAWYINILSQDSIVINGTGTTGTLATKRNQLLTDVFPSITPGGNGAGDVTLAGAQTLTNKTLSGASNTFSNISADALTTGSTNAPFLLTEKAKLAGVETAITVINAKQHGVIGDATTDDAAAISALVASNTAIFLPKGTYKINSRVRISDVSNFRIYGEKGTRIISTATSGFYNPYTLLEFNGTISNVEVDNIIFESTVTQSTEQTHGLILVTSNNAFTPTLALDGLNIHDCKFKAPALNMNAVSIFVFGSNSASNIKFNNNVVDSIGRMGLEVVSRTAGSGYDDVTRFKNFIAKDNLIQYTGLSGSFGCGISLSGTHTDADISHNVFFEIGKNHAVEIVGGHGVIVSNNKMRGITKTFNAISSNINPGSGSINSNITFNGNTIDLYDSAKAGGAAYGFDFQSVINSTISGNTIITDGHCKLSNCTNVTITGNSIFSKVYSALRIDNQSTDNFIAGNTISNAGAAGSSGTVRFFDAGTTNNLVINNEIITLSADGNLRFAESSSASGNILREAGRSLGAPIKYISTDAYAETSHSRNDEIFFLAATGVTTFNVPDPRSQKDPQGRGMMIRNLNLSSAVTISNTSRFGSGEPTTIPAGSTVYYKVYSNLWYATSTPTISLTTTGTSGAATYNPATGAINIPQYTSSGVTATQVVVNNTQLSNTGSTTENTIFTGTIPANSIGIDGAYEIILQLSAGAANANSKVFKVKFNGTAVVTSSSVTNLAIKLHYLIVNRHSLSSQITMPSGSSVSGGYNTATGAAYSTYSINTGADITVTVTCQLANGTDTASVETLSIRAVN